MDAGLGACFFGIPKERIGAFREAFGVPPHFIPIGAISVGYSDEPPRDVSSWHKPEADVVRRAAGASQPGKPGRTPSLPGVPRAGREHPARPAAPGNLRGLGCYIGGTIAWCAPSGRATGWPSGPRRVSGPRRSSAPATTAPQAKITADHQNAVV